MHSSNRRQKGVLTVRSSRNRLFVFLPRELYGGQQKQFWLGLPDNPGGRLEAERKIKAMQADIDLQQFDISLEKYQFKTKQSQHLKVVRDLYPEVSLSDLWNRYLNYKSRSLKETTIGYLNASVTRYIERSEIKSPYQALELREWLLSNTTESMCKRVITYTNAAFNWGLKHSLVKGINPFNCMANELKHNYEKHTKPNAFSEAEKNAAIAALKNHQGNYNGRGLTGCSYSHYASFVEFLFLTGCRPGEAIGLRWQDVDTNYKKIVFNGGVYRLQNGKPVRTEGSKNNKKRDFPCNQSLQALLCSIRLENIKSSDLVFPSPKGKAINYNNFCNNAWKRVVCPIKESTPYNCRDTFISEQIAKGVPIAVIAKWVDTSVEMIEKHYLDLNAVSQIMPL